MSVKRNFELSMLLSALSAMAAVTETDYSCVHANSWLLNTDGKMSTNYKCKFNVATSVFVNSTISTTGWKPTFSGIPDYGHIFSDAEISTLNGRTTADEDFKNGKTTAVSGKYYEFGDDIGYSSKQCTEGYWPPGPECPEAQTLSYTFPVFPSPESYEGGCYILQHQGVLVNGVAFWNWGDGQTYKNSGTWYDLAMKFEIYDMDICVGHANVGTYHHHSVSPCLMSALNDTGADHSPVHGFAYDGYPLYGPYQAKDTRAVSCWKARDYSSAETGCSGGGRTCTFVDEYDITKGTTKTRTTGPSPSGTVTTSSGHTISAASGIYYEDYYLDTACAAKGGEYLDENNGHSHGTLGYHYHMTMDASNTPTFPYTMGPKFYGCLPNNGQCATSRTGPPPSTKSKCTVNPTQKAGACVADALSMGGSVSAAVIEREITLPYVPPENPPISETVDGLVL